MFDVSSNIAATINLLENVFDRQILNFTRHLSDDVCFFFFFFFFFFVFFLSIKKNISIEYCIVKHVC